MIRPRQSKIKISQHLALPKIKQCSKYIDKVSHRSQPEDLTGQIWDNLSITIMTVMYYNPEKIKSYAFIYNR